MPKITEKGDISIYHSLPPLFKSKKQLFFGVFIAQKLGRSNASMKNGIFLLNCIGIDNYKKISKMTYKNGTLSHPIWAMIRELHSGMQPKADITIHGQKLENAIQTIIDCNNQNLLDFLNHHKNANLLSKDITTINGAIAEIVACAELLNVGFSIKHIKETQDSTPDFEVSFMGDSFDIEVNSPQFIENTTPTSSNKKVNTIDHGSNTTNFKQGSITTGIKECASGGFPRPKNKANGEYIEEDLMPFSKKGGDFYYDENFRSRYISFICSIKCKKNNGSKTYSYQARKGSPFVLWLDMSELDTLDQTTFPIETFNRFGNHKCINSNIIWYALYGKKGYPIFENAPINFIHKAMSFEHKKQSFLTDIEPVKPSDLFCRMQHNGRFLLDNKLSAIIFSFGEKQIMLENPWAKYKLSRKTILKFMCMKHMDVSESIIDLFGGQIKEQNKIYKRIIKSFH